MTQAIVRLSSQNKRPFQLGLERPFCLQRSRQIFTVAVRGRVAVISPSRPFSL
jgi:hypothetical protein